LFQYLEITDLKEKNESRQILESTNWNLDQAVDKYFRNKNETYQTSGNLNLNKITISEYIKIELTGVGFFPSRSFLKKRYSFYHLYLLFISMIFIEIP